MDSFAILIPAAGKSVRFGGVRGKLLEPLAGEPVLRHSVRAFLSRTDVSAIIIAAPPDDVSILQDALGPLASDSRIKFCRGGDNRAQSVRNALWNVPTDIAWVAVHDAARPLVSQQVIDRTFAAAREHGAAVPAMPVALTIKRASGPLPARVEQTVPRHSLWAMQTPQAMRRDALRAAFESCPLPLDQVTDDAQLIELAGGDVWLVEGEERNLKITTPMDLHLAELILSDARPA
ncbi:MAG TPA: 2-C-methyl-D-erythritol 4-phosphate cytidylyltransferase [Tepidisphaeraceae bacterium]|nr:2-C-methyl-D-erythritol 4-phosphate cytidylyltransferase [Tepidisphaeraceae bacterium]